MCDGTSYLDNSYWDTYKTRTCYANDNCIYNAEDFNDYWFYFVCEFKNVIFDSEKLLMNENVKNVFSMLGVEPYERFKVTNSDNKLIGVYYIDEYLNTFCEISESFGPDEILYRLINGEFIIIKNATTKRKGE